MSVFKFPSATLSSLLSFLGPEFCTCVSFHETQHILLYNPHFHTLNFTFCLWFRFSCHIVVFFFFQPLVIKISQVFTNQIWTPVVKRKYDSTIHNFISASCILCTFPLANISILEELILPVDIFIPLSVRIWT